MAQTPDQLAELAAAPQQIAVDGQSVTERSADDLIQLEEYALGKKAVQATGAKRKNPFQLLRTVAFRPPGSA